MGDAVGGGSRRDYPARKAWEKSSAPEEESVVSDAVQGKGAAFFRKRPIAAQLPLSASPRNPELTGNWHNPLLLSGAFINGLSLSFVPGKRFVMMPFLRGR